MNDEGPAVVAEWNYNNTEYNISGKVDIDIMKRLLESMYY